MIFLAVDDENFALENLLAALGLTWPGCEVHGFSDTDLLLAALRGGLRPDVAFLDIEMPGISGLELARQVKEMTPETAIIFVTGHPQYALEAFGVHARGYLLKPASPDQLRAELESLGAAAPPQNGARLRVQCFGNFEVYMDGKPLAFPRSKSKELFAYLVHKRGGGCSVREVTAVLFEDREYNLSLLRQTQTIISTLLKTLRSVGAENVMVKGFNSLAVDPTKLDCDFYRFLDGDVGAINAYMGEYMANYSWAIFYTGYLDRQLSRSGSTGYKKTE